MNLDEYVEQITEPLRRKIDELESRDPEVAEQVCQLAMLKIGEQWSEIKDRRRKEEKLKNPQNLN